MLVELSILPLVGDGHLSDELAEVLELIDSYGLPYQLTPTATRIEGDWNEVMSSCASATIVLGPRHLTS